MSSEVFCNTTTNNPFGKSCMANNHTSGEEEDAITAISICFNSGLFVLTYFFLLRLSWLRHPMFSDSRSPRMVPYWIPYFGSTKAFWSDIIGFVQKHTKKYDSDIFGAYIGGRTIIFVVDPFAAASLISGRISQMSWSDTKFRLMNHVMQTTEEGANVWAQMDVREGHLVLEKHIMKKQNLNINLLKYQHHLTQILPNLVGELVNGWHPIGIMELVGEAIYRCTAEALYGYRSFSSHEDFHLSFKFDKSLAIFAGIKSGLIQKMLFPDSFKARELLVEKMKQAHKNLETSTQKLSQMAVDVDQVYNGKMNHDDLTRYRYLYFAAAFMNTVPAGFWAFYETMANEEAFNAVKKEIHDIFARKSQPGYSPPENAEHEGEEELSKYSFKNYFTLSEINEMECLDSIITETLRLRSTNKMLRVRKAVEDFEIKLNLPISKKFHQFNVKKGTYFVSIPTVMHRDPEIFDDPLTFKWDRFLKGPDKKKPVFIKNGKQIIRPVDAFGGGPTMCPGRQYARNQVKAAIASVLIDYDVRFPDKKIPDPPIDHKTFVNSGMPLHDVNIEICKKIQE